MRLDLLAFSSFLAALPGALSPIAPAESACTITLTATATTASWHLAANWDLGRVPGAGDRVCVPDRPTDQTLAFTTGTTTVASLEIGETLRISGGRLDLANMSESSTVDRIELAGGALGGAGELQVAGRFAWSAGLLDGSGAAVIEPMAVGELSGSTVTLAGTRRLVNAGELRIGALSSLSAPAPTAVIDNRGLLVKTAGAASLIVPPVVNRGRVEARVGDLSLRGGTPTGEPSTGAYGPASAGASVTLFVGTHSLGDGARFAGARIAGSARVHVDGTARVSGAGLELMAGGFLGGGGELRVASTFAWTGGTHDGSGTTVIESSGALELRGGANVTLAGTRRVRNEGELRIAEFATFALATNSGALVENRGLLLKIAATTTAVQPPVLNLGRVEARAGTLNLSGGSPAGTLSTGVYGATAADAQLNFTGGTVSVGEGAEFAGVRIAAGRVNVDGDARVVGDGLELVSGSLGGSGELRVAGTFAWIGGTQDGGGTTVVEPGRSPICVAATARSRSGARVGWSTRASCGSATSRPSRCLAARRR